MTITLTDQQNSAVRAVSEWFKNTKFTHSDRGHSFSLEGFAGSGKTTILPDIINDTGLCPDDIAFCAPTGKAAMVMGRKLKSQGISTVPTTIHKLIYRPKGEKVDALTKRLADLNYQRHQVFERLSRTTDAVANHPEILAINASIKIVERDLDRAYINPECPSFQLNVDSTIRLKKLIVVDEASMVGETIADDLLFFGIPLLAIGDPGQLPPVGEKPGLLKGTPDFFLTEIHRQAADNPIIWLATLARKGNPLPLGKHGDGLVNIISRQFDEATYDLDRDVKVICGTNKKRWRVTRKIRKLMGLDGQGPCEGEPLIMTRNSQIEARMQLVNGLELECMQDAGPLESGCSSFPMSVFDPIAELTYQIPVVQGIFEEHTFQYKNASTANKIEAYNARRACEHVDWGHVITAHKSQGSQWPEVALHDESVVFREDAPKWLYTAITRAEKRLTILV